MSWKILNKNEILKIIKNKCKIEAATSTKNILPLNHLLLSQFKFDEGFFNSKLNINSCMNVQFDVLTNGNLEMLDIIKCNFLIIFQSIF